MSVPLVQQLLEIKLEGKLVPVISQQPVTTLETMTAHENKKLSPSIKIEPLTSGKNTKENLEGVTGEKNIGALLLFSDKHLNEKAIFLAMLIIFLIKIITNIAEDLAPAIISCFCRKKKN